MKCIIIPDDVCIALYGSVCSDGSVCIALM
jgi:hypothetical protein